MDTYKIEETDTIVSVGHEKLIANVSGFAREAVDGDGDPGVLIFIPTGSGKTLLDLIDVRPKVYKV